MQTAEIEQKDFRPLFKRFLGSGYFQTKAKALKVTRHTLSNVLGGKVENPKILEVCLAELEAKMTARAEAIERINHLTRTHKQLQGL